MAGDQNEEQKWLFSDRAELLPEQGDSSQPGRSQSNQPCRSGSIRPDKQVLQRTDQPEHRSQHDRQPLRDSPIPREQERQQQGGSRPINSGLRSGGSTAGNRASDQPLTGMTGPPAQRPLFNYPTAPHNGTEPSKDAAESIKPLVSGMCQQVLDLIRSRADGMTCDEVEEVLGMKHQTASARIRDLKTCQPPLIKHKLKGDGSPDRRRTRSGRTAWVYLSTISS